MLRYIFDSTFFKFLSIFSVVLVLIIFIGNNIDNEPVPYAPWLHLNSLERETFGKKTKNTKINRFYYGEESWSNDRKQQTENWVDFLEELDNRGYSIYDPEAEDIWETYK